MSLPDRVGRIVRAEVSDHRLDTNSTSNENLPKEMRETAARLQQSIKQKQRAEAELQKQYRKALEDSLLWQGKVERAKANRPDLIEPATARFSAFRQQAIELKTQIKAIEKEISSLQSSLHTLLLAKARTTQELQDW